MNIQLNKTNPINKILVVGHPLSSYQEVEALLNISGMSHAQPSRRDGFLPSEISTTLCKAHRIPVFNTLDAGAEIKQLEVSPMWNGMALDLFLGNINQEFWGWADSQSVYLLDYWKSVDPQIAFVLVYDTPQQLIAQAFDAQMTLTPETLHRATSNWASFNSALLHFYHRNPERCLLVHAQQVRESASSYLQQVRTRIGAPVLADDPSLLIVEVDGMSPNCAQETTQATLKAYLANELIQQQPESQQLYEELQSVANLPLAEQIVTGYSPLDAWVSMASHQTQHKELLTQAQVRTQAQTAQIETISRSLIGAQTVAIEKQQQIARLEQDQVADRQRIQEREQASALVTVELHHAQEDLERCYVEGEHQQEKIKALLATEKLAIERAQVIAQLSQEKAQLSADKNSQTKLANERASRIEQISQQLTDAQALAGEKQHHIAHLEQEQVTNRGRIQGLQQDSELVVLQLHEVQEDLERRYVEVQHQQEKIKALQGTEKLATERAQAIEQLRQEKAKLSADKDNQTTLAKERASRIEQMGQLLTVAQALAGEKQQHIARLEQHQTTAQQQIYAQQQEKIKIFQITEKLTTEQKNQIKQFSQERDVQTKLVGEKVKQLEQVSQVRAQQEALTATCERLTQELKLQTKLTETQAAQIKEGAAKSLVVNPEQQQENELLLLQLHQVQVELESYHLENQRLKEKSAIFLSPPKPLQYGAVERVKRQLSYRLGAIMLMQSKSFGGWLVMPWALLKQVREFRLDKKSLRYKHFPSIDNYADSQEAEQFKKHLPYRLGAAMVANARSPWGWIKMPWTLRREVRLFQTQPQLK